MLIVVLFALGASIMPSRGEAGIAQSISFDVPSGRADRALTTFAAQAEVTLVFPYDLVTDVTTNRLVGAFNIQEGLDRLLAGTGLRGFVDTAGRLRITKASNNGDNDQMDRRQLGILGALIGFFTNQATAQDTISDAERAAPLAEVTVTARKREENLTDIPVAVSAFSSARIAEVGLADLQSLSKFSPGLSVTNQGATYGGRLLSGIRFRGMNPTVFTPSTQVGALFVDGIYFLGGAQSVGFDDVERVEIIRGPQAAYFGRSTFGGAINYITRDPSADFGGQVSAEGSSFDSTAASLAIEGGLFERLSGRFSASTREKGAQYTATDGGELGRERTTTVNGTLVYQPTDAVKLKFRASYSEDDDGSPAATMISFNRVGNCGVGTPVSYQNASGATVNGALTLPMNCGALPFDGVPISMNTTFPAVFPNALYSPGRGQPIQDLPLDVRGTLVDNTFGSATLADAPALARFGLLRRIERYSLSGDFDLSDSLTLSGAVAYNEQNVNSIRDGDLSDTTAVYVAAPGHYEDYSGEARLSFDNGGKLRAMIGANYYEQKSNQAFANGVEATYGFRIPATGPMTRPNPLQNPTSKEQIETVGAFGSVEYDLIDSLTFTLEGRYQIDEVTRYSGSELLGIVEEPSYESKEFLPRAIVTWRPIDDTTIYAQYAKGTLPGDNTNLAVFRTLTPAQQAEVAQTFGGTIAEQIESEVLDSYELGLKQSLLDGRVRYSLVGYWMKWDNQKATASIFLTADNGRTVSFRIPGDSEIKGMEFEATWAATRTLQLGATANWTDSEYTDFSLASNAAFFGGTAIGGYNAEGNQQPRFPEWSGTLSATHRDAFTGDWSYFIRGDVVYTGKQYIDEMNLAYVDDYTIVNGGIGFENDSGLTIQLFGNNLLDEDGWAAASGNFDLTLNPFVTLPLQRGAVATPIDRRSFGVRATYRF